MRAKPNVWNELTEDVLSNLDFSLDAGDVRAIIGVDAGSFQQWLARGLLDFESVKSGKRTFRKFHITQVPRLILISEIWKNGVLVGEAIHTADLILSKVSKSPFPVMGDSPAAILRAKKAAAEHAPLMLILWFRQASSVYFWFKGDALLSEIFTKEGYSSCVVVHVAVLKQRIREAVATAKRAHEAKGAECE